MHHQSHSHTTTTPVLGAVTDRMLGHGSGICVSPIMRVMVENSELPPQCDLVTQMTLTQDKPSQEELWPWELQARVSWPSLAYDSQVEPKS